MLSVPIKSPGLTVWAAVSYDLGVTFSIGRETMNKERYVSILNQKLLSFIGNDNQHWYQHDGASPHFSGLINIFHNGGLVVEGPRNGHQDLQTSRYWTFGYGAMSKIEFMQSTTITQRSTSLKKQVHMN